MSLSTNLISGLSSGFDWRSMVDQLISVEHRPVDLIEGRKSEYEARLSEWRSFNTKLLSLGTAAEGLRDPEDFRIYTSSMTTDDAAIQASDLLSISTTSAAQQGSYTIKVSSLAAAQKLSSSSFSSLSEELGSAYAGDILFNGCVVHIAETDSLTDVRDKINNANAGDDPSGVTAGIVLYGTNDYRLILTSEDTGEEGIGLLNGSATDILSRFGFKDAARTAKNHVTGGDKSDAFSSAVVSIKTLLGLSSTQTSSAGDIVINGQSIGAIDLSTDTLTTIKDKFSAAGLDASIITESADGENFYRILIEGGANTYTDKNNILETLGILQGGVSAIKGVTGDVSNTSGAEIITEETLIQDIDGYTDHQTDDTILLEGTDTNGAAVGPDTTFTISGTTTVGDLLAKIEALFGDVTASVTGDGKLRVIDDTNGTNLSLRIGVKNADSSADGTLRFDADDDMGSAATVRQREIQAGSDANILIDGVSVSKSENTIDDVITGVSINLRKADPGTTVTLNIDRNLDIVVNKINSFVSSYNAVASYILQQQSYDEDDQQTGGLLFGDGTLSSVKTDLTDTLLQSVWGVSSDFSSISLAGITLDNEGQLSVDATLLRGYLATNFNDIKLLFTTNGSTDSGDLEFISSGQDTRAGEYGVSIERAATQGVVTGSTDLSGGLSGDETLTITQGDKAAVISLSAGMSLSEIVNAVNTELDTVQTETLVGENRLYEGSGETAPMDADTTWNTVYVGTDPANLATGDEIRFQGTHRSGASVSGYYRIENALTGKVQGLLSAVESAYDNQVTASVDGSGRIKITDKYAGNSQLTITFDLTSAHQLDFGDVDVSPEAGDGSREGRYAVAVTASDDGSGHLVLTHDDYGSAGTFTVSQSGDANVREIVYSDTAKATSASSGAIMVSGATSWDGIYGTTVNTGDTVTIGGTTHGGAAVGPAAYSLYSGGAYQDMDSLLSAIEAAFTGAGGSVDARIENGKIILEDLEPGEGSLSLTLTCNNEGGGSDLNLGVVEQTATRDLDLGLVNWSYGGLDVVGTINGENATGAGRILTGAQGESSVDGLAVKVTGAGTGDLGNVRLTVGVAELFDRILFNITDTSEGYVAFKTESLQKSIQGFDTRIEQMETRLNQRMERLINRFVAMELALSRIQSQSDWLAGQLNAAYSGWAAL